jgi:uroporphyrinogen decarboxylase
VSCYEGLCWAFYDQPDLVEAITERLGTLMEGYTQRLLELEHPVAFFLGDDVGFRTGTLISPDHLRAHTLPWHCRFAEMAYQLGLPHFLHTCGNLEAIKPDLVEEGGSDRKPHSRT